MECRDSKARPVRVRRKESKGEASEKAKSICECISLGSWDASVIIDFLKPHLPECGES